MNLNFKSIVYFISLTILISGCNRRGKNNFKFEDAKDREQVGMHAIHEGDLERGIIDLKISIDQLIQLEYTVDSTKDTIYTPRITRLYYVIGYENDSLKNYLQAINNFKEAIRWADLSSMTFDRVLLRRWIGREYRDSAFEIKNDTVLRSKIIKEGIPYVLDACAKINKMCPNKATWSRNEIWVALDTYRLVWHLYLAAGDITNYRLYLGYYKDLHLDLLGTIPERVDVTHRDGVADTIYN